MASALNASEVWRAEDTTPGAIDDALRRLLMRHAVDERANAPTRVLNLVVVVDREWRGEVANRLERVGRYHPSRTIMCAVEPRRTTLNAWATIVGEVPDHQPQAVARAREQIEIDLGPQHLPHLDTIVDPVLVSGVPTVVWSPHGHADAVDSLRALAGAILLDSQDEDAPAAALDRAGALAEDAYVVDLAWLRSTPWRERIAGTFDPPAGRRALAELARVDVRHRPDSEVAGLLLLGWLCSRLGWEPAALATGQGGRRGKARHRRAEVTLSLTREPSMPVPGLSGVTLETASGLRLSLDRGPGGLHVRRRTRKGEEDDWTILGASRGEGGILGEGVRQALLRDPTYRPALQAARSLAG